MLIKCHECGSKVSTEAAACMQCGAPPKFPPSNESTPHPSNQPLRQRTPVRFSSARYKFVCPACRQVFTASGKRIQESKIVKCPYHKGENLKFKVSDMLFLPMDEEQVIYRRIRDFFSYYGRISVSDYWLSILPAIPILFLLKYFEGYLGPLIAIPTIVILHPLWIKRLHDLGMSGNWILIPVIHVTLSILLFFSNRASSSTEPITELIILSAMSAAQLLTLAIAFWPGQKKLNRYGPPKANVLRVWI
jgi:uncharacterized membrane protein YhaH (DUF805 family)